MIKTGERITGIFHKQLDEFGNYKAEPLEGSIDSAQFAPLYLEGLHKAYTISDAGMKIAHYQKGVKLVVRDSCGNEEHYEKFHFRLINLKEPVVAHYYCCVSYEFSYDAEPSFSFHKKLKDAREVIMDSLYTRNGCIYKVLFDFD